MSLQILKNTVWFMLGFIACEFLGIGVNIGPHLRIILVH